MASSTTGAFRTTSEYLIEFYPLWFTYYQSLFSQANTLVGPDRVTPLYQVVVAINVDTIYASSFLDLSVQPAILTIPSTGLSYSVLSLDPYGTVLDTAIVGAGRFGLVGPGYAGPLPGGVKRTPVQYDYTTLIFRIDKFSAGRSRPDRRRRSLSGAPSGCSPCPPTCRTPRAAGRRWRPRSSSVCRSRPRPTG